MEADSEGKTMRAMQQMLGRSQSQDDERCHKWSEDSRASDWLMHYRQSLSLVNTGVWWVTRCYKWSETWVADGEFCLRDWGVTNTSASCSSEPLIVSRNQHESCPDKENRGEWHQSWSERCKWLPGSAGQECDNEWGHYPFIMSFHSQLVSEWLKGGGSSLSDHHNHHHHHLGKDHPLECPGYNLIDSFNSLRISSRIWLNSFSLLELDPWVSN